MDTVVSPMKLTASNIRKENKNKSLPINRVKEIKVTRQIKRNGGMNYSVSSYKNPLPISKYEGKIFKYINVWHFVLFSFSC